MKVKVIILSLIAVVIASSCTISYKFNGASIDYSKTKSISIHEFPNNAPLVYTPLTIQFNNELRNIYARQTRLQILEANGDIDLDGAITGYALTPLSIGANALASENRLSLTVRITVTDNTTDKTTENSFTASRNFDSSSTLEDVQDALITEMIEEIIDQIFNATVANW